MIGRSLFLLLVLILFLSPAVWGQETPVVETELQYQMLVDVSQLEVKEGAAAAFCPDGPTPAGDGHFSFNTSFRSFRFREDHRETGCGEAHLPLLVPEGARSLFISFDVDRDVRAAANTGTERFNAEQSLLLYGGEDRQDPIGQNPYFLANEGPIVSFVRVQQSFPINTGQDAVALAWLFADRGMQVESGGLPILTGHHFAATVHDLQVRFDGVEPNEVRVALGSQGVVGDQVLQRTRVLLDIPDHQDKGLQAQLSVSISNTYTIHSVLAPGGVVVPGELMEATDSHGTLTVTLPSDAVEEFGHGQYEILFASTIPVTRSAGMSVLFLALLAAPLGTGFYATRGVIMFSRRATTGRYVNTARLLQVITAGLWAGYLGLALYIVATPIFRIMNAWPMQAVAAVYYAILLIIAGGFLTMAILSGRHLLGWMENDMRERQRVLRELERSNRELEQFAYVASHDLQEPLRMVTHYTKLLEMRYKDNLDDDARDFIGYATSGAVRMKSLIDGLLAYSRVGRGGREHQRVDASDALERAKLNLRLLIHESDAHITQGRLPEVKADPDLLTMLFQNLVENAIKYRKAGGAVHVHVHAERDSSRGWRFTVQDNGIGIAPKHHKRIFQLFQRLHGRDEYSGTGLGLAVAQRIVDLHAGRIWVESTPGRGSAFHFTIPDPQPARADETPLPKRQDQATRVPGATPEV